MLNNDLEMNRSIRTMLVALVLLFGLMKQFKCQTLDYSLYSHLSYELNSPDSSEIINHYRLNKQTIDPYSQYLHFPDSERERLKNLAKQMFQFGYDNYIEHAFPMDELDPIHCRGRGPDHANPSNININDSLGDYLLTLVDSLSTLAVMGNSTEFKKAARLVIDNLSFDKDSTVQVFEATIRVLGGLISAHMIATDVQQPFGNMTIPNYDNELLKLASDLGVRLLAAFENKDTPIPSPRVNLKYGVPMNGIRGTCTSGAGTLLLEFGMLSTLLNDPIYEKLARRTVYSIYSRRSNETGLFGNELDSDTGEWTGVMSGLGAGIDSYFEYLIKSYILFGDKIDLEIYQELKESLKKYLRQGRAECSRGAGHHPIYLNVHMSTGKVFNNWIDSLQASFPGVQVSDGDLDEAICFHALYFAIWKKFGVLPERYNWNLKLPDVHFYPLRPEFAEATYFLYRATRSPFYLHVAKLIINNIYELTKVECGFATVHDVLDKSLEDRMESFFLSETLKYLYLIFDKENYLNQEGETEYLFTTEGHLFPIKHAYEARNNELSHNTTSYTQSRSYQMAIESSKTDTGEMRPVEDSCNVNSSQRSYYSLRRTLPMKIQYFDQLFEAVGLNDNLQLLLERKSS